MDTAVQLGGRREARGPGAPALTHSRSSDTWGLAPSSAAVLGGKTGPLKGHSPTHHPPLTIRMGPWLESFLGTLVPM